MRLRPLLFGVLLAAISITGRADLTPYKDYDISEAVWLMTTIKVAPNMTDAYLEGVAKSWVDSNEIAKKLGQIEDYRIYASQLPASGDFNLMLLVKLKGTMDLAPSKERYDAFMKEWGEQRDKEITEMAQKKYPNMRKITGDYLMREITLK